MCGLSIAVSVRPFLAGTYGNRWSRRTPLVSNFRYGRTFSTMVAEVAQEEGEVLRDEATFEPYSAKGMTVEEFFEKSMGDWRSQRSSHNLLWTQFEAVTSDIKIDSRSVSDKEVAELCAQYKVPVEDVALALSMSWEGESDWDDDEAMSGSTVMAVVKDGPSHGRLLRSVGYAETIPSVGTWQMNEDGVFILDTFYDAAAAEERIWFATPSLRMRVSQIRTSSGRGVVTASFSTEIRRMSDSESSDDR